MDLHLIEQPISGKRTSDQENQSPSKRCKTDHTLSGKRKPNVENEAPKKRPNLKAFSPIKPQIFKTPSPCKTVAPLQESPEIVNGINEKPPSPVSTPPEKLLLLKSRPAEQQHSQLVVVTSNCIKDTEG